MKKLFLSAFLFLASLCIGQTGPNVSVVQTYSNGAPTGACNAYTIDVDYTTGNAYSCQATPPSLVGAWVQIGGGGGGGFGCSGTLNNLTCTSVTAGSLTITGAGPGVATVATGTSVGTPSSGNAKYYVDSVSGYFSCINSGGTSCIQPGLPTGVANGSALVSNGVSQPGVYQAKPVIDVRDYSADCTGVAASDTAFANAVAAGNHILLPEGCILQFANNTTVAATVTLQFGQGAQLAPAATKTVTVNGSVIAGNRQQIVNITNGTVTFNGSKDIFITWYGAPQNGSSDDAPAANAALTANPGKNIVVLKVSSTPCSSGIGGGCIGTIDAVFNSQVIIAQNATAFGGVTAAPWGDGAVKVKCSGSLTSACVWMNAGNFGGRLHDLYLIGSKCYADSLATLDLPTAMDGIGPDGVVITGGHTLVENVGTACFERHGIAVLGNGSVSGDVGAAQPDFIKWVNVGSFNNRGWGVYVAGGDSNAGLISNINTYTNGFGGIFDNSALGNTWNEAGSHADGRQNITAGTSSNISSISGNGSQCSVATATGVQFLVANAWITIVGTVNFNGTFKLNSFTSSSSFGYACAVSASEVIGTANAPSMTTVYAAISALGGQFIKVGAAFSSADSSSQQVWDNPYCESTSGYPRWGAQTLVLGGIGGHGCLFNLPTGASGVNPAGGMLTAYAASATFYSNAFSFTNLNSVGPLQVAFTNPNDTSDIRSEEFDFVDHTSVVRARMGMLAGAGSYFNIILNNNRLELDQATNAATWLDSAGTGNLNFQQNGGTGPVCFFLVCPFKVTSNGQVTSTVATGTAPFVVASTTNVANLNASSINGVVFGSGQTTPNGPLSGTYSCVNVTPVTVSANVATDQLLQACTIPAGTLNRVGRTLKVIATGFYSTPAASTSQMTMSAKLCTVSGCGSGTVVTLAAIQSGALGTLAVTNNAIHLNVNPITQTAGASSVYETHGELVIDLGAATTAADSIYADTNTAVSSAIDSTAQLFLQITGAFSTASASNSMTERSLIVESVN